MVPAWRAYRWATSLSSVGEATDINWRDSSDSRRKIDERYERIMKTSFLLGLVKPARAGLPIAFKRAGPEEGCDRTLVQKWTERRDSINSGGRRAVKTPETMV